MIIILGILNVVVFAVVVLLVVGLGEVRQRLSEEEQPEEGV